MDKNKYDDLDKLFQSRLREGQINKEEWNTPPPSVFDGAVATIDKQTNRKNRRIIFWILLSAILMGFAYFAVSTLDKINHLENTIADLQSENLEITNTENIELHSTGKTETTTAFSNNKEDLNPEKYSINQNYKASTKTINKNQNSTPINRPNKNMSVLTEEVLKNNTAQVNKDIKENNGNADLVQNKFLTIDPLSSATKSLLKRDISVPFIGNVTSFKSPTQSKIPILVYTVTGINASTIKMTNTEGAPFSLTGYEKYYGDIFAGLGVEVEINEKLSLDVHASYNKMHVKSTFVDDISYDKSLEITDTQGNTMYEDGYNIFSVMGRQSGTLSLALGDKEIGDKDILTNETQIDNSFETIGLSIGALYKPFKWNNFTAGFGAGINYNYLINVDETMETNIYHQTSGLTLQKSSQNSAVDKANRNYSSLYANLRLGYAIHSNYGIKLDLSSVHSMNSIRKTSGINDSKTYINNLKAGLIVYYRF